MFLAAILFESLGSGEKSGLRFFRFAAFSQHLPQLSVGESDAKRTRSFQGDTDPKALLECLFRFGSVVELLVDWTKSSLTIQIEDILFAEVFRPPFRRILKSNLRSGEVNTIGIAEEILAANRDRMILAESAICNWLCQGELLLSLGCSALAGKDHSRIEEGESGLGVFLPPEVLNRFEKFLRQILRIIELPLFEKQLQPRPLAMSVLQLFSLLYGPFANCLDIGFESRQIVNENMLLSPFLDSWFPDLLQKRGDRIPLFQINEEIDPMVQISLGRIELLPEDFSLKVNHLFGCCK